MAYELALTALADPTRRAVFEAVAVAPRAVGEIAYGLPVSRPAVSQHLKILEQAGLVTKQARGTRHLYSAAPEGLDDLKRYLERLWDQALGAFKESLETETGRRGETDE